MIWAVITTRRAAPPAASLRACLLGACLLGTCLWGLAARPAYSQPPDPTDSGPLLTDQMPFCRHLAREVERLRKTVPQPHEEADKLATSGVRLCAIGLVIPGIRRLRYALIELEAEDGER